MLPRFCQYCGKPLEDDCECWRLASEDEAAFIEEYENRWETLEGWHQQDIIDAYRFER